MKLSVTTVAPFVTAPPQPTNHCFDKLSTCSQYDLATQTHVSTQETITERASSGKIAAHTIVHARTGTVITLKARHCPVLTVNHTCRRWASTKKAFTKSRYVYAYTSNYQRGRV
ncbi:uncharacterized protein LOC127879197 isoform X1 [Dreissena polymorpha]|uniref:uncharacterized protein LOC127879197 isoform X1 n=1 Tax=Dreissena polymorpha TaxID=45954 RepID=UPI00226556D8|nr:uncharacterized protein LOC127879197 isoform X1 [Dreissena polymorpha]XP_052281855.1 uncharacterized protein LOC127879197 isoform X1 [Dreissena polymorpha]